MSHTITCTSGTITPDSIELFELDYASGNIIHPIAGSAETDVTFDPASLATGTMSLVFTDLSDFLDACLMHRTGQVFTLASSTRPDLDMSYVTAGRVTAAQDARTLAFWRLRIDFQEVAP